MTVAIAGLIGKPTELTTATIKPVSNGALVGFF